MFSTPLWWLQVWYTMWVYGESYILLGTVEPCTKNLMFEWGSQSDLRRLSPSRCRAGSTSSSKMSQALWCCTQQFVFKTHPVKTVLWPIFRRIDGGWWPDRPSITSPSCASSWWVHYPGEPDVRRFSQSAKPVLLAEWFPIGGGPSSIWMLVLLFQHTATDRFIHVSVMRCHTSMHEQIYIFIGYVLLRIWNPYIYI